MIRLIPSEKINKQTSAPVMLSMIKNEEPFIGEPNDATMERCKVMTDAATSAYLMRRITKKSGDEGLFCLTAQAIAAAIL